MSTPEQTKNALATTDKPQSLQIMIEKSAKELGRALPEHMRPERLVRIALTCIRQTPDLAKCTPESFLGALFTSAQLGIEPIAGRAYLIPFNNSRKVDNEWKTFKECQFVLGYKGVADLFYRHEKAINLAWGVRRRNDPFEIVQGTDPKLLHIPVDGDRGDVVGYWVLANLVNGGKPFHYMTKEECLEHGRKHSKSWVTKEYDPKQRRKVECTPHFTGPWADDQESMCLKTVLVQLMKILPLSVELQTAIAQDEAARELRPESKVDNVLDIPSQVNWEDVEKQTNAELEKRLDEESQGKQSSTEENEKSS